MIGAALFGVILSFTLLRFSSVGGALETAGGDLAVVASGGRDFDELSLAAPTASAGATLSPAGDGTDGTADPASADPAPAPKQAPAPRPEEQDDPERYRSPVLEHGYEVHTFVDHAVPLLGSRLLAPGQQAYGGYNIVGPKRIEATSPVTGLRPVIEQAIDDVRQQDPDATGIELERKVANRLTQLNDWEDLNQQTRERMMILSEVDIQNLDRGLRERTVNHVLHSPLPFGDISEVLTADTVIDLGYTRALDTAWTEVAHLGGGVFQVTLISNNGNGSHTGHVLGRFKVQFTPSTSLLQARQIANGMIRHDNDDNRLHLDEAAKAILNGSVERIDVSSMTAEERRQRYAGDRAPGEILRQRDAARRAAVAAGADLPDPVPAGAAPDPAPDDADGTDPAPEGTTPDPAPEGDGTDPAPDATAPDPAPEGDGTDPAPTPEADPGT